MAEDMLFLQFWLFYELFIFQITIKCYTNKLTDLVQLTLFSQTVKVTKDKVKLRNLHIRD